MNTFLDMSFTGIAWYALVLFGASYIRGFSGFGFTAVLMIGLTMIMPVAEIVPLSVALELIASSGQSVTIFRYVDWRKLAVLLATGVLCTPLGVLLLTLIPDLALRAFVLVFIFGSSIYLIFSRRHHQTFSLGNYLLAGAVIGVANGATALSGLALALFFSLTDESPKKVRATMIAYLFLADIWAGGILLASGFYTGDTFWRVAVSLPLLGLGVWLGSKHFASVRPDTFRTVVLWLLLTLSFAGIFVTAATLLAHSTMLSNAP